MTDQQRTSTDLPPADEATRDRLLRLKRGLDEVKLEGLRRGYGLQTADAAEFDDIPALAAEIAQDVQQVRCERARKLPAIRPPGHRPASSTA